MRIGDWSSDVCSSVLLVEDQPRRGGAAVTRARRLHHRQRMIGDDDVGLRRGARRMFDEAFAEMRTAGIDALAAPVGERGGAVAAEERGEPAGKVAADHVAVAAVGGPARDELRSEAHTSELQSLMRTSYAVFCLTKNT